VDKKEERTTVTYTDKITKEVKEVITVKDLTTGKIDITDSTTKADGSKT
jgi:hypothetical protein